MTLESRTSSISPAQTSSCGGYAPIHNGPVSPGGAAPLDCRAGNLLAVDPQTNAPAVERHRHAVPLAVGDGGRRHDMIGRIAGHEGGEHSRSPLGKQFPVLARLLDALSDDDAGRLGRVDADPAFDGPRRLLIGRVGGDFQPATPRVVGTAELPADADGGKSRSGGAEQQRGQRTTTILFRQRARIDRSTMPRYLQVVRGTGPPRRKRFRPLAEAHYSRGGTSDCTPSAGTVALAVQRIALSTRRRKSWFDQFSK